MFDVEAIANVKYTYNGTSFPYTGAEIESAVVDGLRRSFYEGRDLTTNDIILSLKKVRPVSFIMAPSMGKLYEFGITRCLPVSSKQLNEPYEVVPQTVSRKTVDAGSVDGRKIGEFATTEMIE
jgi:hypothetical protein